MFVNDQRMQFYSIDVLINTILLYEIYINCLNILGAGDSTGFVALLLSWLALQRLHGQGQNLTIFKNLFYFCTYWIHHWVDQEALNQNCLFHVPWDMGFASRTGPKWCVQVFMYILVMYKNHLYICKNWIETGRMKTDED